MSELTATEIRILKEQEASRKMFQHIVDFNVWWDTEGSAMRPIHDEDAEAHIHRVCRVAWINGAFKAS